jgi:hypothetical protein
LLSHFFAERRAQQRMARADLPLAAEPVEADVHAAEPIPAGEAIELPVDEPPAAPG